jgi:hypothetical protein
MKRLTILGIVALLLAGSFAGGWVAQTSGNADANPSSPGGYVTTGPNRIYDSRGPSQNAPRLPAGTPIQIQTGVAGVAAVAVNLTLTRTIGPGWLAAWPSGSFPGTSIMNSTFANQSIANFAILPVAPDGSFLIQLLQPAHVVVDLLGYVPNGNPPPVPSGVTAQITGYGPSFSITSVIGTASNGTFTPQDVRVDVRCPDGTVDYDIVFDLQPGATLGWQVICDGVFRSGASVSVVNI